MVASPSFWNGKSVFLTGHTGFKGGWLALLLKQWEAKLFGYSLEPPTNPSLYREARIHSLFDQEWIADVRDLTQLSQAIQTAQPEIIFHLAAQPLVRDSYRDPLTTLSTNIMGTAHVLEAARACSTVQVLINVTTDKCYRNDETGRAFLESDPLGGKDIYSASKACSEIVSHAYQSSFFSSTAVRLATARAGNVIGGGDWAKDRLVPDFFRSVGAGEPVVIRYPEAVRPWQHVIEPVYGYTLLAEHIIQSPPPRDRHFLSAWNFGPAETDSKSVGWVIDTLCQFVPGSAWEHDQQATFHEAALLRLDPSKARDQLHWTPIWDVRQALQETAAWFSAWKQGSDMQAISSQQLEHYFSHVS